MNITLTNKFRVFEYVKEKYEVIVFALYAILLTIVVSHHEPWMDEAQAWLLAKDTRFKELFTTYLRYEGSPGLWHLILMVPAKLGLPYFVINIISALFAASGVWLFIRYAPFPALIKILYPFTFFVFFQYGVVARNYCLISPILFLIAINYSKKNERPYLFVLLLSLLANISAHTFLIAGSIAFVHFIDVIKNWKKTDIRTRTHQLISLFIFGLIALLVIYIILTPPDQIYANYINSNVRVMWIIARRMVAGSLVMNEFTQLPLLFGAVGVLIFGSSLLWFFKNKSGLVYLLPLTLLCILFGLKYRNLWHQGVLFLLWIFVLWISYEKYRNENPKGLTKAVVAGMGVVFITQIYWCINAVTYDIYHNYSAGYSVAKYIKAKKLDQENIYISGWKNISILPYFSRNIFSNHNNGGEHRFWNWSIYNVTSVGASKAVLDTIECLQPSVVIFASDHIPRKAKITLPGYKPVAFFKGYLCWKTGLSEPECYLIFRKNKEQEVESIAYDEKAASKNKSIRKSTF
ncbi:hypothetical protein [Segetibacter aerophilus]|uniref:Glycosyltransferase RgtA/B/C/D-like domain-containing protein n=1 Tax=Segetibacter aerophilus TaxID=670293 RepID=A0A512BH32_9BACT|nr:hypothetical protein [Segetibacter aerophilus]GEO11273.1 hypothetical protein SAE01_37690 [Segetibacter aerophilus]